MNAASDGMIQAMQNDVMMDYDDGMDEIAIRGLILNIAYRFGFEQVQWYEGSGWLFCNNDDEYIFGWTETAPDIGFDDQV